jgi:hypothetical protein
MIYPEFLLHPQRHRFSEGKERFGECGEVRVENPFKFYNGLIIETDEVNLINRDAGIIETKIDSMAGEAVIVFDPRETFFLSCRQENAISNNAGCRIMIETRDTKNVHNVQN